MPGVFVCAGFTSRNNDHLWERACSGRRSDDSGGSASIDVECAAVIASKLAPTGDRCRSGGQQKGAFRRLLLYSINRQAISAVVSKSKVSSPPKQGQARYANAVFTYAPNFANGDYKEGVIDENDNQVTFEFYSPFMIGCTPPNAKQWGIYDAGGKNGLVVRGKATCPVSISTDQGKTFSKPVRLTTHATTDASAFVHGGLSHAHAFGTMSVARDGTVYTYWIDTRAMAKDGDNGMMYSAISNDDGVTFATDREAFPADICPCCQLSAVAIDREVVFVGARRVYGDNLRDATVARSDDGGRTFGERVRLGGTPWKINGCPHDGGTLVALGGGNFGAVWQRAGEIFLTGKDGKEVKLGSGRQPAAVGGEGQTIVVWNDGSGLVAVRDLQRPEPVKLAPEARFPLVVALPGGKGAVLAYERGARGATSVAVERL